MCSQEREMIKDTIKSSFPRHQFFYIPMEDLTMEEEIEVTQLERR